MSSILGREPAIILGAIQAIIGLLIAFNVIQMTGTQVGAVMTAAAAIASVIVRQTVTPVGSPRLPEGTMVNGGTAAVTAVPPAH